MSVTYEVKAATRTGEKNGIGIYKLTLWANGESHEAELFDSAKLNPQVGQQVTGEIAASDYGPKFKPERKNGFKGGGRPGRSPEDRALDREKNRSIMAESALKTAVEYAGVLARAGRLPDDFNGGSVVQLAGTFYRFVEEKTGA